MKLTGLEQYHWERAGYVLRSGALEELPAGGAEGGAVSLARLLAQPKVADAIDDLLGGEARLVDIALLEAPAQAGDTGWQRDPVLCGAAPGLDVVRLGRLQECLVAHVALAQDETLTVAGGSNTMPLAREMGERAAADPRGDIEGQVCIRLAAGDVILFNGALLHRFTAGPGIPRRTLRAAFVARRQTEPLHGAPTPLPESADLPPRIREWLRP